MQFELIKKTDPLNKIQLLLVEIIGKHITNCFTIETK